MTEFKKLHKTGLLEYLYKTFMLFLLQGASAKVRKKKYPQFFCMPSDYIGRTIIVSGLYEENLLRALFDGVFVHRQEMLRSKAALDVGANIGNHTCFFAGIFKKVFAFEPQEAVFHVLQANILHNNLNNVVLFNFGMGSRDAELPFWQNISGNLGASSFTKPDASQGIFEQKKNLRIMRGDAVVEKECTGHGIGLIKIDVEGLEAEVLEGLRRTITSHKPFIIFEATGDKNPDALLDCLRAMGYQNFYAVEPRNAPIKSKALRFLAGIVLGTDVFISRVEKLENRYYQMLLAAPECIIPYK